MQSASPIPATQTIAPASPPAEATVAGASTDSEAIFPDLLEAELATATTKQPAPVLTQPSVLIQSTTLTQPPAPQAAGSPTSPVAADLPGPSDPTDLPNQSAPPATQRTPGRCHQPQNPPPQASAIIVPDSPSSEPATEPSDPSDPIQPASSPHTPLPASPTWLQHILPPQASTPATPLAATSPAIPEPQPATSAHVPVLSQATSQSLDEEKISIQSGRFLTFSPPNPQPTRSVSKINAPAETADTSTNSSLSITQAILQGMVRPPVETLRTAGTLAAKDTTVPVATPVFTPAQPLPVTTSADLAAATASTSKLPVLPAQALGQNLRHLGQEVFVAQPANLPTTSPLTASTLTTVTLPAMPSGEAPQMILEQVREAQIAALPRRIEIPLQTAPGGTVILHLTRAFNGEIRAQLGADSFSTLGWLNRQIDLLRGSDLGFLVRWLPPQMDGRQDPVRSESTPSRRGRSESEIGRGTRNYAAPATAQAGAKQT